MSLPPTYQYYGYNAYSSPPYQSYPSANIPSLPTYPYLYAPTPDSVTSSNTKTRVTNPSCKAQSTNTLFVKNLPFEMSSAEVKTKFGEFGEIAFIKSQVHDRGIAFVTYYDMRSAEKAYEALHGTEFSGRKLVVDFSFKKNNHNNQKISLFVVIDIVDQSQALSLNLNIVKNFMKTYGEVYDVYVMSPYKYIVKYFDFRCAQNVASFGRMIQINGVQCNVSIPEEDPELPNDNSNSFAYGYQGAQYQPQQQMTQPLYPQYQQPMMTQQVLTAPTQQILVTQPQQLMTQQHQQMLAVQPQQVMMPQTQNVLPAQQPFAPSRQIAPQHMLATQQQNTFAQQHMTQNVQSNITNNVSSSTDNESFKKLNMMMSQKSSF